MFINVSDANADRDTNVFVHVLSRQVQEVAELQLRHQNELCKHRENKKTTKSRAESIHDRPHTLTLSSAASSRASAASSQQASPCMLPSGGGSGYHHMATLPSSMACHLAPLHGNSVPSGCDISDALDGRAPWSALTQQQYLSTLSPTVSDAPDPGDSSRGCGESSSRRSNRTLSDEMMHYVQDLGKCSKSVTAKPTLNELRAAQNVGGSDVISSGPSHSPYQTLTTAGLPSTPEGAVVASHNGDVAKQHQPRKESWGQWH